MAAPAAAQALPVLLSMAMVTGNTSEDSDEDHSSNSSANNVFKKSVLIKTKNTFIDVEEDEPPCHDASARRRSSSAPPGCSAAAGDAEECLPCKRSSGISSVASTMSLSLHSLSASSRVSSCSEECEELQSECESSCSAGKPLVLTELIPAPLESRTRRVLKSTAKSFVPPSTTTEAVLPPMVRRQFAEVIAAGLAVLKTCSVTEVQESTSGWSLFGHIDSWNPPNIHYALEQVKDRMTNASENSNGIYIVGYEATPFTPTHNNMGFTLQLAVVQDEATACWDLLQTGLCRRACACRWQHPAWSVQVTVQFAYSS